MAITPVDGGGEGESQETDARVQPRVWPLLGWCGRGDPVPLQLVRAGDRSSSCRIRAPAPACVSRGCRCPVPLQTHALALDAFQITIFPSLAGFTVDLGFPEGKGK